MTMPSLFPDEEGELLRNTLCMVMPLPPFFRRREDAYDHDHSFSFPEEEGDFLRRRLCMVMATPSPFLEGGMPMIMTTASLCSRRVKMLMTMTNRPFFRKVRMLIVMTMPSLF